jgi:polynucleotide 5'-kinase involved in rRNA processing
MPIKRLPESVAQLIYELGAQQKEPGEIAQILNLKKVQVSTVLAHRKLQQAKAAELAREEVPKEMTAVASDTSKMSGPAAATDSGYEEAADEPAEEEAQADEGIYVGDDADNDPLSWEPMNPQSVQNPHLMIMGESGSGKTYAAQCLVAELAQRDVVVRSEYPC